jgi:ribulose kinase
MSAYFLGVDVGTESVRAALVSSDGQCVHFPDVNAGVQPIRIWSTSDRSTYYEQSSEDIWRACCSAVKVGREITTCKPI